MVEEAKKSIQSILGQRISSPFYGTLLISWSIWNWKIFYLTFFISEKNINSNKIDFIIKNFSNIYHLVWFPLLSTLVLLTLIPFATNAAFWLELKFDKWRIDKKIQIEKKQLLTIEQSINLREQILNIENRFETLLNDKNAEISQLKLIINKFENKPIKIESENEELDEIRNLASKIINNEKLMIAHKIINYYIQGGYTGLVKAEGISTEILNFFDSNKLIQREKTGNYTFTSKGKDVNKYISDSQF